MSFASFYLVGVIRAVGSLYCVSLKMLNASVNSL